MQVINHGNRLSSVAAGWPGGRWQPLTPNADGYWTGRLHPGQPRPGAPPGRAAGARIRVRVTDAAGDQVVLAGVPDRSTVLHASTWMYRDRGLAGAKAQHPLTCHGGAGGPPSRAGHVPGRLLTRPPAVARPARHSLSGATRPAPDRAVSTEE